MLSITHQWDYCSLQRHSIRHRRTLQGCATELDLIAYIAQLSKITELNAARIRCYSGSLIISRECNDYYEDIAEAALAAY